MTTWNEVSRQMYGGPDPIRQGKFYELAKVARDRGLGGMLPDPEDLRALEKTQELLDKHPLPQAPLPAQDRQWMDDRAEFARVAGILSQEKDRGVIQTDDLVLPKLKGLGPDDDPMADLHRLEMTLKQRVNYEDANAA